MWRKRLADLGWFMKCLNEFIYRLANKEDNCKGHFWENRYKSQALVDEVALLSCMSYVDLNPIRAGLADSLETSNYTSIKERLIQYRETRHREVENNIDNLNDLAPDSTELLPLKSGRTPLTTESKKEIPFSFLDYVQLLEWTGRIRREGKKGAIPNHIPPILLTLGVNTSEWHQHINYFGTRYFHIVGSSDKLEKLARRQGYEWFKGLRSGSLVYS